LATETAKPMEQRLAAIANRERANVQEKIENRKKERELESREEKKKEAALELKKIELEEKERESEAKRRKAEAETRKEERAAAEKERFVEKFRREREAKDALDRAHRDGAPQSALDLVRNNLAPLCEKLRTLELSSMERSRMVSLCGTFAGAQIELFGTPITREGGAIMRRCVASTGRARGRTGWSGCCGTSFGASSDA